VSHLVRVFVGSLRKASRNAQLARALEGRKHPALSFAYSRIDDLPHYNEDLEAEPVPSVLRLREELRAAPAVLFVTPEYNRCMPGVLKNAIDWGSRPNVKNCWAGKVGAVTGTAVGHVGSATAQQQLRIAVGPIGVAMLPTPELCLPWREGLFEDPQFLSRADAFLDAFAKWLVRFV
jgi:chromate reductase, NAD(P)H dehydrogenase (quinone)